MAFGAQNFLLRLHKGIDWFVWDTENIKWENGELAWQNIHDSRFHQGVSVGEETMLSAQDIEWMDGLQI